MKKLVAGALIAIPSLVGGAIISNFVTLPFDMARDWLKPTDSATVGAELHVIGLEKYPSIKGVVVSRTTSGTNVELR